MIILTSVNMNKNEVQNVVLQNLATAPANGVSGQIYFNTTDHTLYYHNGTQWDTLAKLTPATASELGAIKIGTDLTVDATGLANVNKSINDFTNYYLKTETYTKTEVDALINELDAVQIQVVQALPATGSKKVIYLVAKDTAGSQNVYDEYIWTGTAFEHVGDTSVNLTDFTKCFSGTITAGQTSVAVSFTGTFSSACCTDAVTGEIMLCDVTISGTTATFAIAAAYSHNITCNVLARQ